MIRTDGIQTLANAPARQLRSENGSAGFIADRETRRINGTTLTVVLLSTNSRIVVWIENDLGERLFESRQFETEADAWAFFYHPFADPSVPNVFEPDTVEGP